MPQKKNPDVPELVRGKTGRVNGHLIALLTLMKSQPLAYNKDNQEDKEPVFDAIDTVKDCLRAFADMIPAIQPKKDRMHEAAKRGFSTATDLADYLVRKGVAFRDAHEIVGKSVARLRRTNRKRFIRNVTQRITTIFKNHRTRCVCRINTGRFSCREESYWWYCTLAGEGSGRSGESEFGWKIKYTALHRTTPHLVAVFFIFNC
jgi:argininosuccinate lyase